MRRRRGFTLIETLISLALSAFLIAGTAELMLRAAHLKKKSDILTAAAGIARDRLAHLRAQDFDGEALSEGTHEEVLADRSTGRVFRLVWIVDVRDEDRKAVLIRAAPDRSAERGVEVRALLTRSLGF